MAEKKHIDQSEFQFVQKDEKLFDKKFETKPIGYFKDAMIRFTKNKVNVVAAYILLTIILLGIFVPIVTTKNWQRQQPEISYLPPRVPFLEKLGFLDGFRKFSDQVSDGTIIDETTGLYLPNNYIPEYIDKKSISNKIVFGSLKDPNYVGGTNILQLEGTSQIAAIRSASFVTITQGMYVIVDIESISSNGGEVVNVILRNANQDVFPLGSTSNTGISEFQVDNTVPNGQYRIIIELNSGSLRSSLELNSITATTNPDNEEHEYFSDGYNLSQYVVTYGSGSFTRRNAQVIRVTFRYNVYKAILERKIVTSIDSGVYYQVLEDNPGMLEGAIPDPNNPNGLLFPEGYPYIRMITKSSPIPTPQGPKYSYVVEYIYGASLGFNELPYFFFGTDGTGKDLFALTWAGIRTSLVIGVVVSLINITIGVVYGAIEGYYGGTVDLLMERFAEVVGRIPYLVVLTIFYSLMGPGFLTLVLILIISGWIGIAGVTRTQFYRYKGREYVLASRTLGAKDARLIFRHILPNGIGTIITSSILVIPGVIFTESTLAFLGFGLGEGQVIDLGLFKLSGNSLGVILNTGQQSLGTYPYLTVFPAIIVSILMITFNMFGNALRDAFNPSLRGAE
jgi:oligopeptide transport system permease protein